MKNVVWLKQGETFEDFVERCMAENIEEYLEQDFLRDLVMQELDYQSSRIKVWNN